MRNTDKLIKISMLSAMAFVLGFVIKFPIIPLVSFLKYDPGDIPIAIGAFMFGPFGGIQIAFITGLMRAFFMGPAGPVGALMNFISSVTFALFAGSIYIKMHTKKGAKISLIIASISTVIVMTFLDLIFVFPFFLKISKAFAVKKFFWPVLGFNLIKYTINSFLIYFLYKKIKDLLLKGNEAKITDEEFKA